MDSLESLHHCNYCRSFLAIAYQGTLELGPHPGGESAREDMGGWLAVGLGLAWLRSDAWVRLGCTLGYCARRRALMGMITFYYRPDQYPYRLPAPNQLGVPCILQAPSSQSPARLGKVIPVACQPSGTCAGLTNAQQVPPSASSPARRCQMPVRQAPICQRHMHKKREAFASPVSPLQ